MKKLRLFGCYSILALAAVSFTACSSDDNGDNGGNGGGATTEVKWTTDGGLKACNHILFTADGDKNVSDEGKQIGNGDQEFVFTGKQTLKKGTYTLKGWVYIANGAELTIEPGTVIKGDKTTKASLIAERGGKLIAQGSADQPIVFTSAQAKGSRRPGDWGGVILCGKAKNNLKEIQIEGGPRSNYGGDDNADNSGVLSYVRIEFAGYPFQTDKEINGLTLGSVGSGTKIDHVQVSYSNDDSFEWFGGDVNCKYLIAYRGWDDDFDTDNGFSGKVQYGLSVRDSKIADKSNSNGFESDNNADGSTAEPYTSAVFSNITFIGPKALDKNFQNTKEYINGEGMEPGNGSERGLFQAAMHIRRNSHLNCYNSVAVGWPIGLILDNQKGGKPNGVNGTQQAAKDGVLKLNGIVFADMTILGSDFNGVYKDNLVTDYKTSATDDTKPSFSSTFFNSDNSARRYFDGVSDLFNFSAAKYYMPLANSPLFSGFVDVKSLGLDDVNYIGAFDSTNDWTAGWTNFDPENADY